MSESYWKTEKQINDIVILFLGSYDDNTSVWTGFRFRVMTNLNEFWGANFYFAMKMLIKNQPKR